MRIGRYVHPPPLVSIALSWVKQSALERLGSTTSKNAGNRMQQPSKCKGGGTICTLCFCFGIAGVYDHSLSYADKLVAQFNNNNNNNNSCLFYSDHSCLGISGRFTQ